MELQSNGVKGARVSPTRACCVCFSGDVRVDRIRPDNRFICVGVDISIYICVTHSRMGSIPPYLGYSNFTVPRVRSSQLFAVNWLC